MSGLYKPYRSVPWTKAMAQGHHGYCLCLCRPTKSDEQGSEARLCEYFFKQKYDTPQVLGYCKIYRFCKAIYGQNNM